MRTQDTLAVGICDCQKTFGKDEICITNYRQNLWPFAVYVLADC